MKQRLLFLSISILISLFSFAQENSQRKDFSSLYQLSVNQFQREEYAICYRTIETMFADYVLAEDVEEHAHFMFAASAFYLHRMDASVLLNEFLKTYPLSAYAPKAYFLLGTNAMNAAQYQDAIELFAQCDAKSLSKKEYADYRFRVAYTYIQIEVYEKALPIFQELLREETSYTASATYYIAYIDYKEGNTQAALDGFGKVADLPDYAHTVPYFVMQLYFNEGKYKEMLNMSEKLLQEDPNESERIELYRLSGAGFYEMKNYASSKEYYLKYLSYQPELLRSDAYRIGMIYFLEKDYAAAFSYFSKVTDAEDALSQNATYHLGLCYLQQQKTDMARMSFERASMGDYDLSTKESALYNYALLCYQTSFSPFNEQVRAFERILTEFPNSKYADKIYSYLADAFLTTKNYQASVDFIDKIAHPSASMLDTKTKLLFLLGMESFRNDQYQEALSMFNSSVELADKIKVPATETYYWRGETQYRLNHLQAAGRDFERFLNAANAKEYKAFPMAHYNLAYCYFNEKNYSEALIWFTKYANISSIQADKTYPDALNRIGDCYYYARNYTKAEEYYQATDKLTPSGNDYAIYQQAFSLGLRKKHEEKADLLASFEKRFPQSDYLDDAMYEEGRAYVVLQQPQQAIRVFESLMEKFPNNPLARKAGVQVGLLYYHQNNAEKAIEAYKKVIALYPGSAEAQTSVNDLKVIYVAKNEVPAYIQYVGSLGTGFSVEAGEQDSMSFSAAEQLVMNDKKEEALMAFKKYIEDFPQGVFYTEANFHCGSLLAEQQKVDESVPFFKEVLKQTGHPFVPEALVILSENAYAQGNYTDALSYYQQLEPLAIDRNARIGSRVGVMRCLYALNRTKDLLESAEVLMQEENLTPEILREARFRKAMSLIALNRTEEALADLKILSKESGTSFGAEARFRLAEYDYQKGNYDQADQQAQAFIREGTSQTYWMARCFVLLADIYIQRGDDFQAKQYLLSLKENYQGEDDISDMITERLNAIAEREKSE